MSASTLVNDAINRVWCSPDQDYHAIFNLHRLTSKVGARRLWSMMMLDVVLPTPADSYHLFSLGHVAPETIALFPADSLFPDHWVWTSLIEVGNSNNVMLDVYFDNGVRIALSDCFITISDEQALILAVKNNSKTGVDPISGQKKKSVGQDDLYLRIYKNAFFSTQYATSEDGVYHSACTPKTTDELLDFQTQFELDLKKKGHVTCWRNGFMVNFISLTTCVVGDVLEYVRDTSVKEVFDFPIVGMPTFVSGLTGGGRYLLHRPKTLDSIDTIDFHDDVDLHLWYDDRALLENGELDTRKSYRQQGVYLHKNAPKTLAMVTHRDHSIPVSVVSSFLNEHREGVLPQPDRVGFSKTYLRMVVRESGYRRTLIDDSNRIKELYRLPDPTIVEAMVGLNALVPTWVAKNLESSEYIQLMSWPMHKELKDVLVAKAYGYDTVVNLLARVVEKTHLDSGQLVCKPGPVFQKNSTAFEHNADGFLTSYHHHHEGDHYVCSERETKYVEFVKGNVSEQSSCYYGDVALTITNKNDWRFYTRAKSLNPQNAVWEDVTELPGYHHIDKVTGKLTWLVLKTHDVMARSNERCAVFERTFDLSDGLMGFTIDTLVTTPQGLTRQTSAVPFGEVDIWINGRAASLGLDVIVNWPRVCVVNLSYLIPDRAQKILVRVSGLCTPKNEFRDLVEHGYVLGGSLSVDRAYDLRSGRASRYYVNGGIRLADELVFAEDFPVWATKDSLNGKPYFIKDQIIDVFEHTGVRGYELHAIARETDTRVSNYLTVRGFGGDNADDKTNVIQSLHRLYSPFIAAIVADLKNGTLAPSFLSGQYSNEDIRQSLSLHEYLLEFDPISDNNTPSKEFTIIEPHCWARPVALTLNQYLYIQRIVAIYAGDKVRFNNHFVLI